MSVITDKNKFYKFEITLKHNKYILESEEYKCYIKNPLIFNTFNKLLTCEELMDSVFKGTEYISCKGIKSKPNEWSKTLKLKIKETQRLIVGDLFK